jgi:hypothetical protein
MADQKPPVGQRMRQAWAQPARGWMQMLREIMPRARSEDDLAAMASEWGPPPNLSRPPAAVMNPAGARLQMPGRMGMQGNSMLIPPPMTQGEARTKPQLGKVLLGV